MPDSERGKPLFFGEEETLGEHQVVLVCSLVRTVDGVWYGMSMGLTSLDRFTLYCIQHTLSFRLRYEKPPT